MTARNGVGPGIDIPVRDENPFGAADDDRFPAIMQQMIDRIEHLEGVMNVFESNRITDVINTVTNMQQAQVA